MTTILVHHPIYREHLTGEGHPERPERYDVIINALRADGGLWQNLMEVEAPAATRGDILACHSPRHYRRVEEAVREGWGYLDPDTVVSPRSLDAALRAAGAACRAVDAVAVGRGKERFRIGATARPPCDRRPRDGLLPFQ